MPKPFSIFRAKRSPSCLSWGVYGGGFPFTSFMAECCRRPPGPAPLRSVLGAAARRGVSGDGAHVLVLRLKIVQGALQAADAAADRMDVRVLERGQDHAAVEVHHARVRPDVRGGALIGPDVQDGVLSDRHGLGPRA